MGCFQAYEAKLSVRVLQCSSQPDNLVVSESHLLVPLLKDSVISVILGPPLGLCYTLCIFIIELLSYY